MYGSKSHFPFLNTSVFCFHLSLPDTTFTMNKNVLLAFNIVLLALVGVLFYLHFSSNSSSKKKFGSNKSATDTAHCGPFRMAYFEMDSIENNYAYLRDVKDELKVKENQMSEQLRSMRNRYIDKVNKFKQEAQTMSQEKQTAMQQDLMQEQQMMQTREQDLGSQMQDESFKKLQVVNQEIEGFLKEYNEDKGYSYIIAYQPGVIYYKDPRYDITADVLKGLNERYKGKKKK